MMDDIVKKFADELRKWWSFDDWQVHTHSWHSREDFIQKKLPGLLQQVGESAIARRDSIQTAENSLPSAFFSRQKKD